MWHQRLMSKIIAADPVLSRISVVDAFNHTLCPAIMRRFADVSALGGDPTVSLRDGITDLPAGATEFTREERERFSDAYPDQSLAAHIINGVFAGYRLAAHFPDLFSWDQIRWQIWTLGFVLHDYGKAMNSKVLTSRLDAARTICRRLGEELSFGEFFPNWLTYLDDILFLAQNTQTKQGAILTARDFDLQSHPDAFLQLRFLASFADVLLHVQEPREVAVPSVDGRSRHINLREKLAGLFPRDRVPRLAYHQVAEVRGLLTNILHNAVQVALAKQGYHPYLYFADGVVYLAPSGDARPVDPGHIAEDAWSEVTCTLTKNPKFGIVRANVGIKVAPPMYELLDAEGLVKAGKQYALDISSAKTRERLNKFGATDPALADDVRCDRLAEFLTHLKRNVIDAFFPRSTGVTKLLLEQLGLADLVTKQEAERQGGGACYGWFYVAAQYFTRHPTMAPEELPALLDRLTQATLAHLHAQGVIEERNTKLRDAFMAYIARALDLDGVGSAGAQTRTLLEAEWSRYVNGKATNRATCSLCSSPFEGEEQTETVVLFKPQQYSAKNRLGGSRVKRSICPICTIEMLLRQAQQEATSGKFQDDKAICLALYPSYFFTPETAQLVKACIARLDDLNLNWGKESLLATLRGASDDGSLPLESLLDFEHFLANDEDPPRRRRTLRPTYSAHEFSGFALLSLLPQNYRDPTDTDAWILPAFYALALPLLLNVKTVASTSFVPLYSSASTLVPTAVLDGAHPTVRLALSLDRDVAIGDQVRVGRLKEALKRLLAFYDLHTDVFAADFDHHWGQLGAVVRDVVTDPYSVFAYYDRKKRGGASKTKRGTKGEANTNGAEPAGDGVSLRDQRKYVDIYRTLGGKPDMGIVGDLVTSYAEFYRAEGFSAYAVRKPLDIAIEVTVGSWPAIDRNDLILLISGAVNDLMERIRNKQADGYDPTRWNKELSPAERFALSQRRIGEFAQIFVDELFLRECDGDRATLRERANQLRAAARFYYLTHFVSRAAPAEQPSPAGR